MNDKVTTMNTHDPRGSADFPPRILEHLRRVRDERWEDGLGESLATDAQSALNWLQAAEDATETFRLTTEEKHQETLDLLKEALAYLQRLALNPTTGQMIRRIEAHLHAPQARLLANAACERGALLFNATGMPYLDVSLVRDKVTLSIPANVVKPNDRVLAMAALMSHLDVPLTVQCSARSVADVRPAAPGAGRARGA
ncbi:MAG: hypothetical protein KA795_05945 [Burkholderiaceae bacterium]|nr:hypothetical protein [Burkholderiaceae bacterium]